MLIQKIKDSNKIYGYLKKMNLTSLKFDEEKIAEMKQDWFLHEAKRITIKNSFEFKLETVGVYSNEELIKKSL